MVIFYLRCQEMIKDNLLEKDGVKGDKVEKVDFKVKDGKDKGKDVKDKGQGYLRLKVIFNLRNDKCIFDLILMLVLLYIIFFCLQVVRIKIRREVIKIRLKEQRVRIIFIIF